MNRKKNIKWRLAVTGIKKNSKLYLPYILAGVGMVAVFYIMIELANCSLLKHMKAGGTLEAVLDLGVLVLGTFSISMLIYTNSFLIKTRIKEFGLYNILGMDKKNIAGILVTETVITGAISIAGGIVLGLLLSKLAEAFLARLVGKTADYGFEINFLCIAVTIMVFGVFFVIVMIKNVITISRRKTIDLLKNDKLGEKPPKARYFMAALGVVLLGVAYYMAVSITDPIGAMTFFFIAVMLVILATTLLFIVGSVTLCKLLQKKKKYYYNTKHFVSLSSMSFRMKRNGVGLAQICILSTMVLVMVASTSCLYFGKESSLKEMFPREFINDIAFNSEIPDEQLKENEAAVKNIIIENAAKNGIVLSNPVEMEYKGYTCRFDEGKMILSFQTVEDVEKYSDVSWDVIFVLLEDYNRYMGTNETLEDDETICCEYHDAYPYEAVSFIDNSKKYRIKKRTDDFYNIGARFSMLPKVIFVVNKFPAISRAANDFGTDMEIVWSYGFDYAPADGSEEDDEKKLEMAEALYDMSNKVSEAEVNGLIYWYGEDLFSNADDFYSMYGGLFFIGIVLSLVFICALGLMIYYKQISEGYEDRSRFEIMQKVGMTEKDIRKSINSQMGSVFFFPLALAVVHLAFAFPMIYRCLKLFNVTSIEPLLITSVISVVIFAAVYAAIYKMTSNSYYKLVK